MTIPSLMPMSDTVTASHQLHDQVSRPSRDCPHMRQSFLYLSRYLLSAFDRLIQRHTTGGHVHLIDGNAKPLEPEMPQDPKSLVLIVERHSRHRVVQGEHHRMITARHADVDHTKHALLMVAVGVRIY